MFLYFYPNWNYAADAVRHGHLPLWNPYLFMGVPFLANSQTGVLYPLNLALAWLPTTRAINLTIILHVWLAGAGAYIFARRSLGLSRLAAWLGAVTFALGGYLGAQVEHVNQLQALAWLPFLFVFFDLALERWRIGVRAGGGRGDAMAGRSFAIGVHLARGTGRLCAVAGRGRCSGSTLECARPGPAAWRVDRRGDVGSVACGSATGPDAGAGAPVHARGRIDLARGGVVFAQARGCCSRRCCPTFARRFSASMWLTSASLD